MLKFIEGKAPLVVKKCSIGKEEAGAYFVIKGLIVDSVGEVVEYLVTRVLMPNTNDPRDVKSDNTVYSEEKFIALVSEFGNLFADYKKYGEEYRLRYTEFPVYCRSDGGMRHPKPLNFGKERFLALMAGDDIIFADNTGEIMGGSVDTILRNGISVSEMLVGHLGNRFDGRYFEFVRDYRESEEYKLESVRSRLVGDSCCHLVPSAEQFSISYTARINGVSNTGVCNVPSLATLFYCFAEDLEDSRVKIISFEKCLGLRKIVLKGSSDFMDSLAVVLDSLAVVLPSKSLFGAPKVAIAVCCKEFRLKGSCKRIELSITRAEHIEIEQKSLSDAKRVYFAVCKGLKSLTFNRARSVILYDTDTEELFCHVPLGGIEYHSEVRLEKCSALKIVKLSSDKFNPSIFGGVVRECDNLEELSIETDSLVRDGFVIDLCSISKKLKRFSLTLNSRFSRDKAIIGSKDATFVCEIIAPSGADVTLEGNGVDLSKYFKVTYE